MSNSGRSRAVDQQIIAELQRDARQSNVALARRIGLTEGAIRRRIDNLIAAGELRFAAIASPEITGLTCHALLRVRCAPHLVGDVLDHLAAMPEFEHVYLCTGPFDVTAIGRFESMDALRDAQVQRIGTLPGIVEMQSDLILQSVPCGPRAAAASGENAEHSANQLSSAAATP